MPTNGSPPGCVFTSSHVVFLGGGSCSAHTSPTRKCVWFRHGVKANANVQEMMRPEWEEKIEIARQGEIPLGNSIGQAEADGQSTLANRADAGLSPAEVHPGGQKGPAQVITTSLPVVESVPSTEGRSYNLPPGGSSVLVITRSGKMVQDQGSKPPKLAGTERAPGVHPSPPIAMSPKSPSGHLFPVVPTHTPREKSLPGHEPEHQRPCTSVAPEPTFVREHSPELEMPRDTLPHPEPEHLPRTSIGADQLHYHPLSIEAMLVSPEADNIATPLLGAMGCYPGTRGPPTNSKEIPPLSTPMVDDVGGEKPLATPISPATSTGHHFDGAASSPTPHFGTAQEPPSNGWYAAATSVLAKDPGHFDPLEDDIVAEWFLAAMPLSATQGILLGEEQQLGALRQGILPGPDRKIQCFDPGKSP